MTQLSNLRGGRRELLFRLLVSLVLVVGYVELSKSSTKAKLQYVMKKECILVLEPNNDTEFTSWDNLNWHTNSVHVEFKKNCETTRVVKLEDK